MFAVPGWSLSPALLKTQTSDPSHKKDSSGKLKDSSKKRKRAHEMTGDPKISNKDVSDLWRQHIEGMRLPLKAQKAAFRTLKRESQIAKNMSRSTANVQPTDQDLQKVGASSRGDPLEPSASKNKRRKKQKTSTADDNAVISTGDQSRLQQVHVATIQSQRSPSRSRSQKKQKAKSVENSELTGGPDVLAKHGQHNARPAILASTTYNAKLTPLQAAMRKKLTGARFRHLNQTLYTTPSSETRSLFEANPTFFEEYHSGFRQQVSTWPENPVDGYVEELKQRGIVHSPRNDRKGLRKSSNSGIVSELHFLPLPRSNGICTVADLGCGDASLASQISKFGGHIGSKHNIKVCSYDLHSPNPLVTRADIADLPLADSSVDVAIFCLALMGTNWVNFVEEAWRVLHWKGELWVAEIKSRFGRAKDKRVGHSVGRKQKPMTGDLQKQKQHDEEIASKQLAVEVDGVVEDDKEKTDVSAFVEVLRNRGFALENEKAIDLRNKMFVKMKFVKALPPTKGKNVDKEVKTGVTSKFLGEDEGRNVNEATVLLPCYYKIR